MTLDTSHARLETLRGLADFGVITHLDWMRTPWLRSNVHWLALQGYISPAGTDLGGRHYTLTDEGKERLREHREGYSLPGQRGD